MNSIGSTPGSLNNNNNNTTSTNHNSTANNTNNGSSNPTSVAGEANSPAAIAAACSSAVTAGGNMPVGGVQSQNPTQGLVHWMSAVMAEHMTSNSHHDPTVGMHYMWNGGVDVSDFFETILFCYLLLLPHFSIMLGSLVYGIFNCAVIKIFSKYI